MQNDFVCRKCFTALTKFSDLQLSLSENITKALLKRAQVESAHVGEKRAAVGDLAAPKRMAP